MYRAFTRCLQIMLGTHGTFTNPILLIIAPQQVLPSEQVKESQNYKETKRKKKGNSKICNLGFLDELQLCELPEINQKMSACMCIFLGKRPWLSSDSQDSWWLTKPLE